MPHLQERASDDADPEKVIEATMAQAPKPHEHIRFKVSTFHATAYVYLVRIITLVEGRFY